MASEKPRRFAQGTRAPIDKSQGELRTLLRRYGADGIAFGEDDRIRMGVVTFRIAERSYKIFLPLPDPRDDEIRFQQRGAVAAVERTGEALRAALDKELQRRWRAMLNTVKALLVATDEGIVTIEEALALHTVMPDGRTAKEHVEPWIQESYRSGTVPPLLPALGEGAGPQALGPGKAGR
jgi:hypothetical protein